jgi:hypothetical protein
MRCDRTVKMRHLLDEEGFHYSQFVTLIVVITITLLTSSPNYFKYEKNPVKRTPIPFFHYWTKGEENFTVILFTCRISSYYENSLTLIAHIYFLGFICYFTVF